MRIFVSLLRVIGVAPLVRSPCFKARFDQMRWNCKDPFYQFRPRPIQMDSLLKGRSLEDLEEAVVDDGAALAMQQLHEMQIDALKLEPKYKVL